MSARFLVAGVGNALFGDDGFGPAVTERLADRLGPDAEVRTFGVRAIDLVHALMDGPAQAILVDATPRGDAPGTLYVLEPRVHDDAAIATVATHGFDLAKVLQMVRAATGRLPRLTLIGCEPGPIDEMQIGLSPPVEAAVEPACELIETMVREAREAAGAAGGEP